MRSRTLAAILFLVSITALIGLFSLLFRVQVQSTDMTQPVETSSTARPASLIEIDIQLPTVEPPKPVFAESWGRTIDISDWKSWGEPLPVVKESKGRNGSWALDPGGDGNYSSGVTSRFQIDLRQGAAIEFWAKGITSHKYWQSLDIGFSQAASVDEYLGIEQQPIPLVGIHVGAETEQDYVEYFLGSEREREVYTPLNDQWHLYRLEVDPNGSVHFFRDGELKFAPENPIDLDLFAVRPVVLEGRSYQTDMLIDDLAIYGTLVPPGALVLESTSSFFHDGRVINETTGFVRSPILPDMDGDGDPDIVLSSVGNSNRILVYENPGQLDGSIWPQTTIGKSSAMILQVATLDFGSDGDLDIVSGGMTDEDFEIILWQNNGTPFADSWSRIGVGTSPSEVQAVLAADMDDDGDPDLITGSGATDVELHLWENPGQGAGGAWTSHELGATDDSVLSLALVDLDGDGDLDLISGGRRDEDYELIAWINDDTPFNNSWQAVDIGDAPGDVYALTLADFDGDGDTDLASAGSWHGDPQIVLWRNDGTPLDGLWESNPIGTLSANTQSLVAIDVDKDGRVDLISSSEQLDQGAELILWQSGDSPFAAPWTPHPIGETGQTTRLTAGDVNGDGVWDLVTGGETLLMVWEGVENDHSTQ